VSAAEFSGGHRPPLQHLKRQLTITTQPIDEPALLRERQASDAMGAVIYFLAWCAELKAKKDIGHRIRGVSKNGGASVPPPVRCHGKAMAH